MHILSRSLRPCNLFQSQVLINLKNAKCSLRPEVPDELWSHILVRSTFLFDVKGTHTVCFIISFYNINQKPIAPRTNFHYETTKSVFSSV